MNIMASEELGARLRALAGRPYTHAEVAELLGSYHAPEVAGELEAEYAVMPTLLPYLLLESWRLADQAGKRWEFTSVAPDRPVEFARNRRVRLTVDVDEHGVTFGVAHVQGRKADWYQPEGPPVPTQA